MSAIDSGANSPYDQSTATEAIESFTESVTEALAQAEVPESVLSDVQQSGDALAKTIDDTVTSQAKTISEQGQRIEELEVELKEERETRAREDAQDRKRLYDVEERVDTLEEGSSTDETPTPETGETTLQDPETPLEDVIRVPEHLVEESLSANQQRARFVAKDIHQYTKSVPAGRAIKSSELRRVLTAKEEGEVYTETVSRVIRFLDELGEDDVTLKETQGGERVIVFTDEFVKRVVAYRNQSNTVVTGEEATG